MKFGEAERVLRSQKFMSPDQGRIVYEHVRRTRPERILEIGTAFGTSAAYMAAALDENGVGTLTTVEKYHFTDPISPEEQLGRLGLTDRVEIVRIEHSSYVWWLKEQLDGRPATDWSPPFDFCYLDGAHDFLIDGMAVVLIAQLLRPGAWLLLDDLQWSYAKEGQTWEPEGLSRSERETPHVRAVFDNVIAPLPWFGELRLQWDGWWGWARRTDTPAGTAPASLGRGAPGAALRWRSRLRARGRQLLRR